MTQKKKKSILPLHMQLELKEGSNVRMSLNIAKRFVCRTLNSVVYS